MELRNKEVQRGDKYLFTTSQPEKSKEENKICGVTKRTHQPRSYYKQERSCRIEQGG